MADEPIRLDIGDFNLDEVEEIEDLIGRPFMQAARQGNTDLLYACYFVTRRRVEPEFTWADARAVKLDAIIEASETADEPDPTTAAAGEPG